MALSSLGLLLSLVTAQPAAQAAAATPAITSAPPVALIAQSSCRAPKGMLAISRSHYQAQLQGFWLGLSIGNWTGLITEMDKIGGTGSSGQFYRRTDWGGPDQPSIWGQGIPSELSKVIDWYLVQEPQAWGSDDDSDIEYIYLQLMHRLQQPLLNAEQIRAGWLAHIYTDQQTPHRNKEGQPENFLWVSNQQAFDLMQQGLLPPFTGMAAFNPHYDMIDAQLTTELFGALAPARPDIALQLAYLPTHTTAAAEAADIAAFYQYLHAMVAQRDINRPLKPQMLQWAEQASTILPANQYPAKMYHWVKAQYLAGLSWEQTRDDLYRRYQLEQQDGYHISAKQLYCNGCFAAGINFAASLISYFYGAGDMQQTLKIAVLAGWDSDNPAATWGGLYGLILGKNGIEQLYGQALSDRFFIHRTRRGFANNGMDSFHYMAQQGVEIIDVVVKDHARGQRSPDGHCWFIPPQPLPAGQTN